MDIYKKKFPKNYDWLILSGLFNDKTKNSEVFMYKIIKKMYLSCKKGIVFNGLNKYVDYEDKALFYNYPDKVFKYCINNLEALSLFSKQFVTCASWTRLQGFESQLSNAAALLRGDRLLKSFHYLVPDHRSE